MTVVAHKRPHTPPMASPFLEFDLTSDVVLMALKAGAKIPAHKANGQVSVQLLSGHIRLNASERASDLLPGVFSRWTIALPTILRRLKRAPSC